MSTETTKPTATPGPWEAGRMMGFPDDWAIYAPDPSTDAEPGNLMRVASHLTAENARLMAAAPDYAAACGTPDQPDERLGWLGVLITCYEVEHEHDDGCDQDAEFLMLQEVRALREELIVATAKAQG